MKTVNVAELKDRLSSYLDEVEKGEEFIVINRKKPVARLLPVDSKKQRDEWELVLQGKLRLPAKPVTASYLKRFFASRKPDIKGDSSLDALGMDRHED